MVLKKFIEFQMKLNHTINFINLGILKRYSMKNGVRILSALIITLLVVLTVAAVTVPQSYQQKVSKLVTTPEAQSFFGNLSDDHKNIVYYLTTKEVQLCVENTTKCKETLKTLKLEPITKEKKYAQRTLTYDIISTEGERLPLITKRLEEFKDTYEDARADFLDAKEDLKDCESDGDPCSEENEKALDKAKDYLSIIIDMSVERLNLILTKIKLATDVTEEEYTKAQTELTASINSLAQLKGQISLSLRKKDAQEHVVTLKNVLQQAEHSRGLYLGILSYAKTRNMLERARDLEEKLDCTASTMEGEAATSLKDKADSLATMIGEVKVKQAVIEEFIDKIVMLKQQEQESSQREIGGVLVSLKEVLNETESTLETIDTTSKGIYKMLKKNDIELRSCKTEEYVLVKLKVQPKPEAKPQEEKKERPEKDNTSRSTVDLSVLELQTAREQINTYISRMVNLQQVMRQKQRGGERVDPDVGPLLDSANFNLAYVSSIVTSGNVAEAKEKLLKIKENLDKAENLLYGRATSQQNTTRNTTTRNTTRTNTSTIDTLNELDDAVRIGDSKANSLKNDLGTAGDDIDELPASQQKDDLREEQTVLKDEALDLWQLFGKLKVEVGKFNEDSDTYDAQFDAAVVKYTGYKTRLNRLITDVRNLEEDIVNERD